MGGEEFDTDEARKAKRVPLLKLYDVPIEHLSYEYVTECRNGKELERILKILRSGEEGFYPELIKHTENRLKVVKPNSDLLFVAKEILKYASLDPEEIRRIDTEIENWMRFVRSQDEELKEGKQILKDDPIRDLPIRNFSGFDKKCDEQSEKRKQDSRISSCDYKAWDKYDADTEINKMDLHEERQQLQMKAKQKEREERLRNSSKKAIIEKVSLTGTEINVAAEQEKVKGNEAFKSGDFEDALELYNSSISIDPTLAVYNNRALTYIKLRRYDEAIEDCDRVLSVESENIKALLRRGLSYERLERRKQALADYESVLAYEPTNKLAIEAVKKLREPSTARKVRIEIEEVAGDEDRVGSPESDSGRDEESSRENEIVGECENKWKSREVVVRYANDCKEETKCSGVVNEISHSTSTVDFPKHDDEHPRNFISEVCYCNGAPSTSWQITPYPHIKNSYCLGLPKSSSEDSTSSKSAKHKSIFSYVREMDLDDSQGVVIRELPIESDDDSLMENFEYKLLNINGDSEDSSNVMKEIKRKNNVKQATNNRFDDISRRNDINDNKENYVPIENSGSYVIANENHLYSKNVGKGLTFADLENINSPYEFIRIWNSIKDDSDLKLHAHLLRYLPPENFDNVIGNKLDGNMFSIIVQCLEKHFLNTQDTNLLYRILHSCSQLSRFSIVKMFINNNEKIVLKNIFGFMESQSVPNVTQLCRIFNE